MSTGTRNPTPSNTGSAGVCLIFFGTLIAIGFFAAPIVATLVVAVALGVVVWKIDDTLRRRT